MITVKAFLTQLINSKVTSLSSRELYRKARDGSITHLLNKVKNFKKEKTRLSSHLLRETNCFLRCISNYINNSSTSMKKITISNLS